MTGYPSIGIRMNAPRLYQEPVSTDVLLDPAFPHREELLQFIWEQRLFDARGLCTVDGEAVEVLRPGLIQRGSGPDLADARVRIAGCLWAGAVEVHVRSSEWYAHGHAGDPAYAHVVLHVAYVHDADVRSARGHRIPSVELRGRIAPDRLQRHQALMEGRAWVPCAPQLRQVEPARIGLWLERLSVERLERRSHAVLELHRSLGGDAQETFWHLLARAFGHKLNAEAFALLARTLPLRVLRRHGDDALQREALLFGQAALLPDAPRDAHTRALRNEHDHLSRLHGLRPMSIAAWRFGGLRPPNFPTVRLAQLSAVLGRCGDGFGPLLDSDDPATALGTLSAAPAAYWRDHLRFDHPAERGARHMGPDASCGILMNAVVPYLFAMGRLLGRPAWCDRAIGLLERLPAETNAITRGWKTLGVTATTAARSQALLELKNLYCAPRRCLSCVIGTCILKGGAATCHDRPHQNDL